MAYTLSARKAPGLRSAERWIGVSEADFFPDCLPAVSARLMPFHPPGVQTSLLSWVDHEDLTAYFMIVWVLACLFVLTLICAVNTMLGRRCINVFWTNKHKHKQTNWCICVIPQGKQNRPDVRFHVFHHEIEDDKNSMKQDTKKIFLEEKKTVCLS